MEGVTESDPKAGMMLREDLGYVIVGDELLFMELSEEPFRKG